MFTSQLSASQQKHLKALIQVDIELIRTRIMRLKDRLTDDRNRPVWMAPAADQGNVTNILLTQLKVRLNRLRDAAKSNLCDHNLVEARTPIGRRLQCRKCRQQFKPSLP